MHIIYIANPLRKIKVESIKVRKAKAEGLDTKNRREEVFSSSEGFTPHETKQLEIYPKNEESKSIIRYALSRHYLFETLGEDDMERIVDCMRPVTYNKSDIIICEGDFGDQFYVIESGEAVASVIGQGNVNTYTVGGCFGELALIFNSPRAASVVAVEAVKAWTIDLK